MELLPVSTGGDCLSELTKTGALMEEDTNHVVGKLAIVLGAGMGGLAAAAALSDFFEQVTVLERDALPEKPTQRSGAPQGRHVHGLLMGGQNALEELLPGFR